MFEKRKPIVIGETYVFDALNESNQAVKTSLVTVIKKGNKRKHWYVISINNRDIFECPEELLTPYTDYDEVAPIVRCQYGETDFDYTDVEFFGLIDEFIKMNIEVIGQAENYPNGDDIMDKFKTLRTYNDYMRNKVKKYADISTYKYHLATICNLNKFIKTVEQDLNNKESDTKLSKEVRDFTETLQNSKFYEMFDQAVQDYAIGEIEFDDFIEKALDILEEDFPEDGMIAPASYGAVEPDDIQKLKRAAANSIYQGNIVFLVGRVASSKDQVALAVYNMEDFEEIDTYINNVYDGWDDRTKPYDCKHRIVMLSVPKFFRGGSYE